MRPDPVDQLIARIEELERLFAALKADPSSPAWREIERRLAESRPPEAKPPAGEPRAFIRGGFGEEMDLACAAITEHFLSLPGWQATDVSTDEVVHLAGFFAFIALASSPTAPLDQAEAAVGARATVARILLVRHASPAQLNQCLADFKSRLNQYSALWAGVLKGDSSFGTFASCAFENLHIGGRTLDGYLEHLDAFPDFCERRIKAFHEATEPRADAREAGTARAD